MKFRVNSDLKLFDKAVKKLAKGERALNGSNTELSEKYFAEAMTVIKKHRLYKQALDYYSHSEILIKRIKLAFGEYLEQRGYSEEAGFLFSAGGDTELALHAFMKSLNVEMCMAIVAQSQGAIKHEEVKD